MKRRTEMVESSWDKKMQAHVKQLEDALKEQKAKEEEARGKESEAKGFYPLWVYIYNWRITEPVYAKGVEVGAVWLRYVTENEEHLIPLKDVCSICYKGPMKYDLL